MRQVSYDNERGKGDHRQLQRTETPYVFGSVEQLMPAGPAHLRHAKANPAAALLEVLVQEPLMTGA